jgi:hypothetical protein
MSLQDRGRIDGTQQDASSTRTIPDADAVDDELGSVQVQYVRGDIHQSGQTHGAQQEGSFQVMETDSGSLYTTSPYFSVGESAERVFLGGTSLKWSPRGFAVVEMGA